MSIEPRTAIVNVFVTKPLEIDEPTWCAGHPDNRAGYKVDISHDGPEQTIAPGGRDLFKALLTQAPFASTDRSIGLYIEADLEPRTCTPDEVDQFADDLIEAAAQLRVLGRQLAEILAGEDR
ncbi:DUF6907 domain-containing protein [Streptomyces prunicolor]|uniref:DUF6907 domain-containing protein n=1 Tax=Streptomyces prunicolor TaxID=67348 RepID=UPI00036FE7C7|nr:hypothetical protein [Streptomyces prunicolor]